MDSTSKLPVCQTLLSLYMLLDVSKHGEQHWMIDRPKKRGALVSRMLYLGAFPLARCLIPITGAGEQS